MPSLTLVPSRPLKFPVAKCRSMRALISSPPPHCCVVVVFFFSQYLFICLVASGLSCGTQIFMASREIFHCDAQTPLVVTHRLSSCGSGSVASRQVEYQCPDQGSNPRPLHCQVASSPLDHQGSPLTAVVLDHHPLAPLPLQETPPLSSCLCSLPAHCTFHTASKVVFSGSALTVEVRCLN